MPICPRCNATIHTGAEEQCPACGYSIVRANAVFGDNLVEFTRVVDAAGALRHRERMELLHMLENLERSIPPVALCIYITDDGQSQEFRTHAHWILNHARIHHPSFGKREKMRTIEEEELTERFGRTHRKEAEEPRTGMLAGMWQKVCNYVRDAFHPLPPPVRQEWMLILVVDVQLEQACFSWGYMLDPYVNQDAINTSIIKAKLHFRERAMLTGLKNVMKYAVEEIAANSHKVNKKLRKQALQGGGKAMMLAAMALAGLGMPPLPAQAETAPPAPAAAETAEAAAPATPETPPAPAPPPPAPGAAASYDSPPRWAEDDYRRLMAGELINCYTTLHTPVPVVEEADKKKAKPAEKPKPTPRPRRTPRDKDEAESDTKVPARYWPLYTKPSSAGLCDPQQLYTTAERNDVERALRELNAHSHFRIYATLFKAGQQVPQNLGANTLVTATAQPCEYAVLVHYKSADVPELELGYMEIKPDDTQRHEWLVKAREAAAAHGGGIDGLLAAIRSVHAGISAISSTFTPITPETAAQAPLIPIKLTKEKKERALTSQEKFDKLWAEYGTMPNIIIACICGGCLLIALLWFFFRRKSGVLYASQPDVRLASPYGAGVSRMVRYLEGAEASKEKRIF